MMAQTTDLLSANVGIGDFGSSAARSVAPCVGSLLAGRVAEARASKDKANGFGVVFMRNLSGDRSGSTVHCLDQTTW